MNLESQVVSLELAKRLKELGVKQESYFYYGTSIAGNCIQSYQDEDPTFNSVCSAFTVAELGEMLPDFVELDKIKNIHLATVYSEDNGTENNVSMLDDTEANVRAKTLIYLLENGLMELKNV